LRRSPIALGFRPTKTYCGEPVQRSYLLTFGLGIDKPNAGVNRRVS
jgi:hypothetical protein